MLRDWDGEGRDKWREWEEENLLSESRGRQWIMVFLLES